MRLVTLAVLVGCGSSADKPTSLDDSKLLSNLSKDEAKQYCRDMKAWRDKKITKEMNTRLSCAGTAIASVMSGDWQDDTAIRAACKKKLDECTANPPKDMEKDLDCDKDEAIAEMLKCPALTVGEMSGCVTEMNEKVPKLAEDPCSNVSAAEPMKAITKFIDQLKGPKCEVVESKCKGIKGSKKPDGPTGQDDAEHREALTKMEGFTKQMCDCKDRACVEKVSDEMTKWGNEMSGKLSGKSKPGPELAKQAADTMGRYTECMTKQLAEPGSAAPLLPAPAKQ